MPDYQFSLIITTAVLQVITLLYQGYLSKKGQNKADKEDIAELTKIVESVKADFIRENAKINSDLDIIKDRRGKNYSQAQQAIINFYNDFNTWLEMMASLSPELFDAEDTQKISEQLVEIRRAEAKVKISNGLMDLLVSDVVCTHSGYVLIKSCLNLSKYVDVKITKIYDRLILLSEMLDTLEDLRKNDYQKFADMVKRSLELRHLHSNSCEEYRLEFGKLFLGVEAKQTDFKEYAKNYLNN